LNKLFEAANENEVASCLVLMEEGFSFPLSQS